MFYCKKNRTKKYIMEQFQVFIGKNKTFHLSQTTVKRRIYPFGEQREGMHSSSKAFTFVLCCSSFTSHMLKVVSSKAEKHKKKKKIAFVADCWEFYFSCFSPKTKNIPCTHEIYAVGFFSFLLLHLQMPRYSWFWFYVCSISCFLPMRKQDKTNNKHLSK